jgi:PKD repeat protein
MIDSTNGRYTDGAMIGSHTDNNLMFPKQMLIDDAKTNVVEMEMTSCFDLCASSPAEYYQISTDEIPSLRGVNFPSDYVLGGHYQCDVTVPTMIDTVGQILDASKDAGTSYSTLNTLSKYMTAVKSATITANVNGGTTTITVVNDKSITDFTLKAASGSIASAKCDGATLTVTKDTATGSAYITKTIAAGTHTFIINTTEQVSVVPTASFDSNITNGMTPLTVQFNSTLTNVKSVSWKFGDGSATVKTNNATHTFVNTRKNTVNYIVTLTATGNNGAKVTATKTITIQPVPVKPVPAFTISAKSGNTNTIFKFTDKSTSIPTTWSWDFGDGAASTDKIAMHQYATAGTYTVTLIVGNNAGSVQLSKTVTVVGIPPKAAFVYSPTPVKKGVVTTFTDTSTQNPSQWLWAFSDDGSTATTATTTHTFTKTGSATVTLTVTNNAGSKTVTKQINVR